MARGKPQAISLGPGYLYLAPLGTTEPTNLTTPWASVSAAWTELGYTNEGSEFTYELESEPVVVAEELDPVAIALTGRNMGVNFALAQITASNLKVAMNGGTITAGTGIVTFEPPELGQETNVMIGFESEDHSERWVYRQCLSQGQIGIPRRKGADKALINCEFLMTKPEALTPFKAILEAPRRA
ncbi:phage tail tube protein [Nonomuraea sp. 10N515B]|uniref:phage tail tube protein n=1 Tax=Nonomuraea sp. 10N515B TaxID=3457422 RepID=UPI003FCE1126